MPSTGETVARLKRYGVKTVELGVQSMDERVLTLSGRGTHGPGCGAGVQNAEGRGV
jgi:histone acetyltransferase (RNA polymerase elongator complex component)